MLGKLKGPKSKGLLFILLAIICGLIAAGIVLAIGKQVTPNVPVLVADCEITRGDPIKESMVKVVNMPPAGLPSDAIGPQENMENVIAAHGMLPGDVIRESGIIRLEGEPSLLSARLEALDNDRLRAVEVPVEAAAGLLGGMKAGDRVDILAVKEIDNEAGTSVIAETIIEKARVIGVRPPEESQGVLIVALTQDEAEILAAARSVNKIYAALCPCGISKTL